jgi:hypothetical protein
MFLETMLLKNDSAMRNRAVLFERSLFSCLSVRSCGMPEGGLLGEGLDGWRGYDKTGGCF